MQARCGGTSGRGWVQGWQELRQKPCWAVKNVENCSRLKGLKVVWWLAVRSCCGCCFKHRLLRCNARQVLAHPITSHPHQRQRAAQPLGRSRGRKEGHEDPILENVLLMEPSSNGSHTARVDLVLLSSVTTCSQPPY